MLEVDRHQALAYRIAAQGLHRTEQDLTKLAVFGLGVQDNQRDTALLALIARLDAPLTANSLANDPRFALAWTHRGAPHFHRRTDLAAITQALTPLTEADAMARMGWQQKQIAETDLSATEVFFTAARAMRKAVRKPTSKGAASTAVTKLVPPELTYWCRG